MLSTVAVPLSEARVVTIPVFVMAAVAAPVPCWRFCRAKPAVTALMSVRDALMVVVVETLIAPLYTGDVAPGGLPSVV